MKRFQKCICGKTKNSPPHQGIFICFNLTFTAFTPTSNSSLVHIFITCTLAKEVCIKSRSSLFLEIFDVFQDRSLKIELQKRVDNIVVRQHRAVETAQTTVHARSCNFGRGVLATPPDPVLRVRRDCFDLQRGSYTLGRMKSSSGIIHDDDDVRMAEVQPISHTTLFTRKVRPCPVLASEAGDGTGRLHWYGSGVFREGKNRDQTGRPWVPWQVE